MKHYQAVVTAVTSIMLCCSATCIMILSTYTGEVENGLRNGQGTYWCAITGSTYVGQWVLGRREGRGRLNYSSPGGEGAESAYYNGEWVDNQQEGFGTRRYRYDIIIVDRGWRERC